jgi:hypothetical protein
MRIYKCVWRTVHHLKRSTDIVARSACSVYKEYLEYKYFFIEQDDCCCPAWYLSAVVRPPVDEDHSLFLFGRQTCCGDRCKNKNCNESIFGAALAAISCALYPPQ